MANANTEVDVKKNTALAVVDYDEDAGSGFEQADKDAYAIPYLSVLQSGSPQVKKSDGAYIKGAEEGSLFNSVTQEITPGDTGVKVIPCYYTRRFVRWGARETGGGLKAEYTPDDPIISTVINVDGRSYFADENGEVNPKTNDILVDTRNHYVMIVKDDGSFTPAVVSMTSSQLKKSRQWMSKMDGLKFTGKDGSVKTKPMFSHIYTLSTVPESNDAGSWFGYKITLGEEVSAVSPALYAAAKAFQKSITAGEVKVQQPTADSAVVDSEDF
jgi:hypothetical protein